MGVIELSNPILGSPNGGYSSAGAPTAAVNAVQTVSITGTPTGGTIWLYADPADNHLKKKLSDGTVVDLG